MNRLHVMRATPVMAAGLSLMLWVCSPVSAQTRSTVTGTVKDSTGAMLPGVTVTLASPNLVGGPRVAVTNADAVYRIPELVAGTYDLTAELQGFRTMKRTGLRVLSGTTLTLDLELEVAAVAETVVVSGVGPTVDVKTSAATTTMDRELLQNLPLSHDRRLVVNLIELAPGTYSRAAFGAARDANGLIVDGTLVSDPGGGGIVGAGGISHNWIEEAQFVSLGANAEHGEFTGTGASMVIRGGSNQFTGLVDYWTTREGWVADNRGSLAENLRPRFSPQRTLTNWDLSVQAGGRIKRDRLFFFGGVNYIRRRQVALGGTTPWDDRWPRFIAKLSWAPSPNLKIEGFVAPDSRRYTGGDAGGPLRADRLPETGEVREKPAAIWNARATWAFGKETLLEIRNGGLNLADRVDPTPPGTLAGPAPRFDQLTGIRSVNLPQFQYQESGRSLIGAALTRYVGARFGKSHELKFGVEFEQSRNRIERGFPGGRSFLDFGGAPNLVTLWDGSITTGIARRTTLYAQDKWGLTDRLTLEPGVRVSVNRGSVPDKGTVFRTSPVSLRVGAAWDVARDHRTVLRAHYGRFHEGLLTAFYDFMNTSDQTPRITARVVGPGEFVELTRFTPRGNLGIDENLTQAYMEQYLVGVERELLPDLSLQVQYIRRDAKSIFAFTDTGSRYEPVQRRDPGPDGRAGTADDGELLTVFNLLNPGEAFLQLTNPEEAFRRYDGLQVVAKKRYSRNWQLLASYTLSKTEGTVSNQQGEHAASGSDTGQAGVFANPNRAINRRGRAELDFTHQGKVEGTYRLPLFGGVNVSGVYLYVTGVAWGRTVTIGGLRQGNETVRVEPRGTRRTRPLRQFDLRVEKTLPLGAASRTLGLYLDVLNVSNYGLPILRFVRPVIEASGPNFGLPRNWMDARTLQAGARLTF